MIPEKVILFAQELAVQKTEAETDGGFCWETAAADLNTAILEAREVTGIDPQHPKVYCVECGVDREDCSCDEEEEEAEHVSA